MNRSDKETNLIGSALFLANSKGVIAECQEIIRHLFVENKSLDLETITELEILLDTKLLTFPTDKEWLIINRRKKLLNMKIKNGEILPNIKYIKVDENGTATLEDNEK